MYKQNLLEMTQINPRTAKPFSLTNQPKVPIACHFGRHLGHYLGFVKNIYLSKIAGYF